MQARITGVAPGSKIDIKGIYPLQLEIGSRKRTLPVYVVRNMTQKCILGIKAIKSFGLSYHASKEKLFSDKIDHFQTDKLVNRKQFHLEAFEVANITVKNPPTFQGNTNATTTVAVCPATSQSTLTF